MNDPIIFWVWMAAGGVIGTVWLIRYVATLSMCRKRQVLTPYTYDGPPPEAPMVSVVVAAKDEQEDIEACIRGLLDQDYPNYEIIAVDDRSTDRTPVILRRMAKEAPDRLRVLTIHELRDGWFGKNNAMREGVQASQGEWLLFTDADCRQDARNTLSLAMREAVAHEVDFLSVTPTLETRATWERIVQPVCALALMIWFLPHQVNKPKRKTAYANGAFMLMKRSCYDAIGGHERVKTEVNEDIHMARFTKETGRILRVVENEGLYHTRMYDTFAQAWRGWSRIFYGSLGSLTRLAVSIVMMVVFTILPWLSLVIAAVGYAVADVEHAWMWQMAMGMWLVVVTLEQIVTWHIYGILRADKVWSLAYVLGALVTLGMLLNAMWKVIGQGRTTWRGTTYRGHQLEAQVPPSCQQDRPPSIAPAPVDDMHYRSP